MISIFGFYARATHALMAYESPFPLKTWSKQIVLLSRSFRQTRLNFRVFVSILNKKTSIDHLIYSGLGRCPGQCLREIRPTFQISFTIPCSFAASATCASLTHTFKSSGWLRPRYSTVKRNKYNIFHRLLLCTGWLLSSYDIEMASLSFIPSDPLGSEPSRLSIVSQPLRAPVY